MTSSTSLKVRVLTENDEVLFEASLAEANRAYEEAARFEDMGLAVRIDHPNVNQTLAHSLGVSGSPLDAFHDSLAEELEEHPHEGSCCFSDGGSVLANKTHH